MERTVLAVNAGSSSLRIEVLDPTGERALASRHVEAIPRGGHGEALRGALERLPLEGVAVAGHRIVHGGTRFAEPTVVDDEVRAALEEVAVYAPLHDPPALRALDACREALGDAVPQVAVFDTAFHRTMPRAAQTYAIEPALARRHGAIRFGFHGLAHEWMLLRWCELTGTPRERARLVTFQLGGGCSVCAIDGGRSVETSMGMTPLEGLVMGTRSGDVDPTLAARLGAGASVVLNERSGLLALSGRTADMRELLDLEAAGDDRARLAIEVFCHRARRYLGAYLAVLGGADAVVFGGGIGEHALQVRARILDGMEWAGIELDPRANAGALGEPSRISPDDAAVQAWVIPVRETSLIARAAARFAPR